ncbi:MAG: alpha/beta hydrolase [Bacteroidales bacterium]|nr:alpha/beta hydrolase [Bacteroidales bacterium]
MKRILIIALAALMLLGCKQNSNHEMNMSTLTLTQEWDKTFPKSELVNHRKITFHNRYGIELAADMYIPKEIPGQAGNDATPGSVGRLPAIAVSGPFGAVKEQTSGIYAQHMAERGFLTLAFDPSFTGESGGEPRRMASPDINTEDFCAAVDFLSTCEWVDPERIGIIGICGFGGMAINAAALDPRIKATVTSTMYDMSRVAREGYFGSTDSEEARDAQRQAWAMQRTEDYRTGTYKRAGGVVDPLPEDAPWFVKDYHAYYKTQRGYHARSGNSNDGWNVTGTISFLNQPLLDMAGEIKTPVLLIHGEKAHSRYFSEGAFAKLKGDNKELLIIPGAVHTDLYDDVAGVIPYDRMEAFFKENLK